MILKSVKQSFYEAGTTQFMTYCANRSSVGGMQITLHRNTA